MAHLLDDNGKNIKLALAVASASALGTLALCRFLGRTGTARNKKYVPGSGPTGNGKWRLYHTPSLMSSRCVWLLEGTLSADFLKFKMKMLEDFEIIEYDPYTASPEEKHHYRKNVHPHGTIPALVTSEGDVMTESATICLHLAQLYGHCLPDKENEATYFKWIFYTCVTGDSSIRVVFRQLYKINKSRRDPEALETHTARCLDWVNHLESQFADGNREFICTNGFTAADTIVGYSVCWLNLIKEGSFLSETPNVRKYLNRLRSRPLWEKCMGDLDGYKPDSE